MDDALAIANAGSAGYGVTLDLDALDPRELPAVATPASFGIRRGRVCCGNSSASRATRSWSPSKSQNTARAWTVTAAASG